VADQGHADPLAEQAQREIVRLTEELATVRAELAALRRRSEEWGEREARIRTARDRAVKSADALSAALARRLRIDAAGGLSGTGGAGGRKGVSLFKDRQQPVTKEEAAQLELIRGSALFDDAW
jgi:hypothetical protein